MSRNARVTFLIAVLAGCLLLISGSPALAAGTTYYVNCAAASDGNGSSTSPWNNLATVNSKTFAPGDSLLFNRGTTCTGSFVLVNTSYVTMQDLEVKNSRVWGVLVTTDTDAPAVGVTLKNLVVHDVTGGSYNEMGAKWTGLVVFSPGIVVEPDMTKGSGIYTRESYFDTVLVDNVNAYNTTLWAGIFVWGVQIDQDFQWKRHAQDPARQSRNITIQNSTFTTPTATESPSTCPATRRSRAAWSIDQGWSRRPRTSGRR
jgi:hypothetical protein